ncbi:MAG: MarR family transcriptional regulator [Proteobacteria bacterium]|nr:MarR family transcriptional regulator [Pseudomonadota bacterium]
MEKTSVIAQQPMVGCTLEEYSECKKIPAEFLKSIHISDSQRQGVAKVKMQYLAIDKTVVATRERISLNGEDRFRWQKGDKPCLYGLWRLPQYTSDYIILCEGESDCQTLWYNELPAIGIPGATNWNEARDNQNLERFNTLYVIYEQDSGAEALVKCLERSSLKNKIKLVSLGGHKDPSGLYISSPENFLRTFEQALTESVPFREFLAGKIKKEAEAAWKLCEKLATAPNILDYFEMELENLDFVGQVKEAKIIYLALISRFLDRPISIAVKGQSSGGKSFLVETVLSFFTKTAFYSLTTMSEKAMIYSQENFSHRFIVIYEASGLKSEMASYLIRSLLSEGKIEYEFVERTVKGTFPKKICKEGPTGLIVTTTEIKLHPENETRMFSLTINDTPEQTKNIFNAIASTAKGIKKQCNREAWQALQQWLETCENKVIVPYADKIAELMPAAAIRLRRDIKLLFNLVKASAILHQKNRQINSNGEIEASIEDYKIVHELISDIIAEQIEATVSKTVIETTDTVKRVLHTKGEEERYATLAEVSEELKLDKSTVSRRLKVATEGGYIERIDNNKRGSIAKYVLGNAIPKSEAILPTPEQVLQCCTNNK